MQTVIDRPTAHRVESFDTPGRDERPASSGPGASGGHLTFRLGSETYCIDILRVQEIRGYSAPTRIADAPRAVMGVVNLRGTIVPIVDLRRALGMEEVGYDAVTASIVVTVGDRRAGLVVDAVADVVDLMPEQVSPPPLTEAAGASGFITGLATVDGDGGKQLFLVIDVARLLAMPAIGLG